MIVRQGIVALQQKLAAVIQELTGAEDGARGDDYEPRSPAMNGTGANDIGMNNGYTTPYDGQGNSSIWGGGGGGGGLGSQTPYMATPYGQSTQWGGS